MTSSPDDLPAGVRRAATVVCFWESGELVGLNYATADRTRLDAADVAVLDAASYWTPPATLPGDGLDGNGLAERIGKLVAGHLLHTPDRGPDPRERAFERWSSWMPAAALFHQTVRDTRFRDVTPPGGASFSVTLHDQPAPLRTRPEGPPVPLPPFSREGGLRRALLERRTWRRFADRPISRKDLSTLLGLTWGVQGWFGPEPGMPLKTSPSGGARHSVEAWVLALNVDGLAPGVYHYGPDAHDLVRVSDRDGREVKDGLLPSQPGFDDAAAIVFMTSIFERVQWRYEFPRAYRVVTIELGHLAQTFCLLATDLGLAPFCTAAIADSRVEELLGVDGVNEAVLYAVGVGHRPEGVGWALRPAPTEAPPVRDPSWARGDVG